MVSELTVTPPGGAGECHSLNEALQRLRRLRNRGEAARDFTIYLAGGVHPVTAPIVLTEADSWPLTIRNVPGETPVLDGGVRLADWRNQSWNGRTVWIARVPASALAFGPVRQLFVNGERRVRSRFPKGREVFAPAGTSRPLTGRLFTSCDRFRPAPSDWSNQWSDPQGIEAVLLQKWTDCRLPVESFDPVEQEVVFGRNTRFEIDPETTRYFWENIREQLTEPGEYYFDRNAGEVWYLPRPGETPETIEAVVPALGPFLIFSGRPENPVRFLRVEGLTFRHGGAARAEVSTCYDFHTPGLESFLNGFISHAWVARSKAERKFGGSPQAAAQLPGLVSCFHAADLAIHGCRFENAGWSGVLLGVGCDLIRVERCAFRHLGGGGVVICGGSAQTLREQPELATRRALITDNHIGECGEVNLCSVGILIGHAAECVVEHNHIHDLYYSAISCGWSWGYAPNAAHDHRIGFNHLHDLGKGMLCDMGGVYLLGVQPGTRVYNNLIHDVNCRFYGGWGIYTDEGSSHVVVEENICYHCSRDGFHQHYGRENVLRYNISAFNGDSGLRISAGLTDRGGAWNLPGEHYRKNINFFGNVVVQSGKTFFLTQARETLSFDEFYSEANWFFDPAPNPELPFARNIPIWFEERHPAWQANFAEWQAEGHDRCSRWGDPGFVDLAGCDFHLSADSPLRGVFPDPARTLDQAGIRPE